MATTSTYSPGVQEVAIARLCLDLEAPNLTKRQQELIYAELYKNLVFLCTNITAKKYGVSDRIDLELIAHEVTTSAIMTIIKKKKVVSSWVSLLRKMVHDNVCKHLVSTVYNPMTGSSSVNIYQSAESGSEEILEKMFPFNDLSGEVISFFFSHIKNIAEKTAKLSSGLGNNHGAQFLSWACIECAFNPNFMKVLESVCPPQFCFRVSFYSNSFLELISQVTDRQKLESTIL
jgi:hypothetical protein